MCNKLHYNIEMFKQQDRGEIFEEKFVSIVDALESIPDIPELIFQRGPTFDRLCDSIEAAMEVVTMILEDFGERTENDLGNVLKLGALGIISPDLVNGLVQCIGLRILLSERLDCFDERIALESIQQVRDTLYEFMDVVDRMMDQIEVALEWQ
jgi:uncharacterized protein YutE (UPF0331/DUF86 family)